MNVGRDTELQCKHVKMFSENRKFEKKIKKTFVYLLVEFFDDEDLNFSLQ